MKQLIRFEGRNVFRRSAGERGREREGTTGISEGKIGGDGKWPSSETGLATEGERQIPNGKTYSVADRCSVQIFFSKMRRETERNTSGKNQANYGFPHMNQVVSGVANAFVDLFSRQKQAFACTRR